MDVNIVAEIKDGDSVGRIREEAPPIVTEPKPKIENGKKKRRRGKFKRKLMKPYMKIPWQERRNIENSKRSNRFRKMVMAKTHAPFNNNQFLMEIHKPEPENNFEILQTPSARTRDSSFSIDSEENYFYSLPADEEEYLTKEFSSVYEDAQTERLTNMSKDVLIQEYLLLEAKYDNLVKRTERSRPKYTDEEKDTTITDKDTSESMITERNTSSTSEDSSVVADNTFEEMMKKLKEQDQRILELEMTNENLRLENENLRNSAHCSSSKDSESDSSSTSDSSCSSTRSDSPVDIIEENNGELQNENHVNGLNEVAPENATLVNGFHNSNETGPMLNGDL